MEWIQDTMTPTTILDANGEEATPSRSWLKQQLTLPNLVLACSIAFWKSAVVTDLPKKARVYWRKPFQKARSPNSSRSRCRT